MPFHCKQFSIEQSQNSQKVGSDSMLLGAWTKGECKNILDIGTGTGLLALMQAQKFPTAKITAIEPNEEGCQEAINNFNHSSFKDRIEPHCAKLQAFKTEVLFDLIISNPPYFDNDFLSPDQKRNNARHTESLPITDLYNNVRHLLDLNGMFYVVFPEVVQEKHYEAAKANGLFPQRLLKAKNENGIIIRHFVAFSTDKAPVCEESDIIIKYNSGFYSKAYVELTRDFYLKDLPFQ